MAIAAVVALTTLAINPGNARGQTAEPAPAAAPAPAAPAAAPAPAPAPAAAPAAEAPSLDAVAKDVADIKQYFNNLAPTGSLTGLAGPGHNAFLMVCAALVLFMTLPGLALFYGGLVRSKNVLSVLAQCLGCAGLVTILWYFVGYTMIFGEHPAEGAPSWAPYLGSFKYAFLEGVTGAPNTNYTAWPSQSVFSMYQLMFAIITPGLIVGAIAERMKFSAIMLFIALWMFIVYFPLAHMVWGRHSCHRLRWWHGRSHVLRLVCPGALHPARQTRWLRQGEDGASQHGACHGGYRNALGRLVWFQRGFCPCC